METTERTRFSMKPYYSDSSCQIFLGDCRTILPTLPKVDLVLTDPPYGISHSSNHTCESTTAKWMNQEIAGDGSTSLRDSVLSTFNEWACCGVVEHPTQGHKDVLIWDKGPASGMGDLSWPWKRSWEAVFLSGRGWRGETRDEGVLKGMWIVTRASMGRTHPNEKPVALMGYLIARHSAQTILDPFMGSGTTLVAAKRLGRKAIGVEICEAYCEIAARRLQQEYLPLVMPEQPKLEQPVLI